MQNKQLQLLFDENDIVWTGNQYELRPTSASEFFCINPLRNLQSRKNEDVTVLRNFLLEFDGAPLTQQRAAIKVIEAAGLPIRTAVFSGSKSLHFIISLADTLTVDYKSAWLALSAEVSKLTGLEADEACKNPARLSRLAGHVRGSTGKEQTLEHTGKLISNEKILQLMRGHQIRASTTSHLPDTAIDSQMDIVAFKFRLKLVPGLHSRFQSINIWAQPENMYGELLRLTLWAIDSTGVPKNTFTEYAEDKIFPALKAVGYPESKLYKPIDNAYIYKKS